MTAADEALAKHFGTYDASEPFFLTHLQGEGDERIRVMMEERVGRQLWVRPLDDGEAESTEPISVNPGDIVIPFTPMHSTSINTTSTVGDTTGFVIGIPLIEVRRDDDAKVVFARTRRVAEPMPTQRVRVPFGYQLTIGPGDLVLELEWIDQMFPPDDDGYAPLTNTIWTWMSTGPVPGTETLTRYLLAASRRLDAAHRSFQRIRQRLDAFDPKAPGPHARLGIFEIVGDVETTVVSLSRAVDMATKVGALATISVKLPRTVKAAKRTLTAIRNAYEHIDASAQGRVSNPSESQALMIFDWTSLFNSNSITLGDYRLDLNDVPRLLLDTRTFLKEAAASRPPGATASPPNATSSGQSSASPSTSNPRH